MGILDEAIREHLELKRQHGADENELQGLESEAFGPADRPDATDPSGSGEAETQIISPGSSITAPAGEGDQLDKVFEATRQEEASEAAAKAEPEAKAEPAAPEAEPASAPDATFAEHPIPDPPAAPAEEAAAEPEVTEAATVESPEARPTEPAPTPEQEGDAGDMLEAERHHLSSHPTEHYDVDAAIAEEDEIDVLSESSLSDELDRALESGEVAATGGETVEYQMPPEGDSGEIELDEPDSAELETGEPDSGELDAEEDDSAELLYQDAATEDQPVEEAEPETGEEDADSEFFDQDDPLEATPDFLEETPEHDRLWFEQKEPKDFDFGD